MDIRTHLQQQADELCKAIEHLSQQRAWVKERNYTELARAYLVGQTELLRRLNDVNALIDLIDGKQ